MFLDILKIGVGIVANVFGFGGQSQAPQQPPPPPPQAPPFDFTPIYVISGVLAFTVIISTIFKK
jgi:hypothetical protein